MSSFDGVNVAGAAIADLQTRLYHELGIRSGKALAALNGVTGPQGPKGDDRKLYNKPYDMPEEKWVWVTGYKGMDKDMKCMNNFQYEIGKTYDMPEGEEVSVCSSGFHMCLDLKDVYEYVRIGSGNRFFEVRALVRECDKMFYRSGAEVYFTRGGMFYNKLAAKSIEIVRELSVDEILAHIDEAAEWPGIIKDIALTDGVEAATAEWHTRKLMHMGYSEKLAKYICGCTDKSGYDLAVALDSQPGISMDTKVLAIFSHI